MNKYVKEYLKRGLIFGGFGPIVFGIVIMIIGFTGTAIDLKGWQILLAIASTYILAFVQAGSSIFEQIDSWSHAKSMILHLLSIYVVYLGTYLVNSWIPFNYVVVIIFSASVIVGFIIIWLIAYLITNKVKNELNAKLNK